MDTETLNHCTVTHPPTAEAASPLSLSREQRLALWQALAAIIEGYLRDLEQMPVAPVLDVAKVRGFAESFRFAEPRDPVQTLQEIAAELMRNQVHTPHPQYFGLFNPAPATMSIAADALVAAINPQLAAWSHSPLAAEIERHLILSIGQKFGFDREATDGVFTSGGAEANQTALLAALFHAWPRSVSGGVRSLDAQPVLYISAEGHHSFLKAARATGLGSDAIREIAVGDDLRMSMDALRAAILADQNAGFAPFMVVATAGTTGAGVVDPLPQVAQLAREEQLWFHVDAAWGGAAALVPELRPVLDDIEAADSITFDAHKWLSVPMGAGIFLTRHPQILTQCFATQTAYMPKEGERMHVTDAFAHSLQWSRRFIGLKLFLSLAVAGWDGYAGAIRHQAAMGDLLRRRLVAEGWTVVNQTALPLVCFTNAEEGWDAAVCQRVADAVVASGHAWISTIRLGESKLPALRACITNHQTEPRHIEALIVALNDARSDRSPTTVD